jgi:nanoRNase/pAp phosphatase (c-di-AMP/oligoRNAs hydrolase)
MTAQDKSALPLTEALNKIKASKSVLIILPSVHNVDVLASGLALYMALKDNFSSKNFAIASATDVTVNYQRLYSVGDISKNLGSKNLVISLNTAHENVEQVSSDDENGKFNIVIKTKDGAAKLTDKDFTVAYRGVDADLIISLGISQLSQVGELLNQEADLFTDREHLVITASPLPLSFGTIKLQDGQASGTSEIVTKLLRFMKMNLNPDICTNLVAGLEAATNNFAYKTTAETFAAVSFCMKNGGKRNHLSNPASYQTPAVSPFMTGATGPVFGTPSTSAVQGMPVPSPVFGNPNQSNSVSIPNPIPSNVEIPLNQGLNPISSKQKQDDEDVQPQKDWYEPKIFKAGQNNS